MTNHMSTPLTIRLTLTFLTALLLASSGQSAETKPLQDKTLVVWAAPANLTQRGGSVLTLEDPQDHFDGIVFGEIAPTKWMAGSDGFCRTQKDQSAYFAETADANTLVQMASIREPPAPFRFHAWPHIDCRDLAVVKNPSGDGWLGYVMMRRKGQADAFHSSCITLCRSQDLVPWEVGDPVCTPNRFNCFEVPDVFQLGDKWYLIALTGDGYGQSRRWSDPHVTAATIVFQADRAEGPFEEIKDNLLLASTGQQGYSARTVARQGERLMLYTRVSEPYARLAWPVKLEPRVGGGLNPTYWPGLDKAFGTAQNLPAMRMDAPQERLVRPLPGVSARASSFMVTATVEFQGANAAGIQFGQSGTQPGFAVELRPQEGPAGQLSLVAISGKAIQTRHWPLPKSAHQLRLIVVEQMVDVYVDDVLVINRCVPNLRPGAIGLAARGGAVAFEQIRYTTP